MNNLTSRPVSIALARIQEIAADINVDVAASLRADLLALREKYTDLAKGEWFINWDAADLITFYIQLTDHIHEVTL